MPDTLVATQVTDAGGNYNFAGLTPGEYIVKFIAADGSVLSTANVGDDAFDSDAGADGLTGCYTLSAGQTETSVDAGFYEKAEIGDRVWLDANKNGIQDAGEAGVSGVTARLVDADGNVVATATTDANGNYLFDGLTPGQYRVDFDLGTLPAGFAVTTKDAAGSTDTNDSDANPGTGETTYTTLESGESDLSWDMGIVATPARIGDRVWLDANANGVQDAGEAGVSGVTIELKDAGGTVIGSTTTDASGNYFFDVEPGTYSIAVTAPAGFVVTGQNLGGNEATDSDIDPATGMSDGDGGGGGRTNLDLDAGFYETGSIGDRVWVDANGNGVQDAGEVGKAGVTVELYTCVDEMPGTLVDTKVTDANGNYNFSGLVPGDYIVKFIAADGSVLSTANVGDDAFDSDAGADGFTGCYTLTSGENNTTVDAGFYETASIGDRVWVDANGNGVQDAGEAGVSGVTARLVDADGNVVATATTDANGNYLFDGLTPGQYRVDFDLGTLPAGFAVTTKDAAGSTDTNDSDANPGTGETTYTTLESGESDLSWDMGIVATPARIGDRVWLDANANGVQDAGEAGVSGVTIELKDAGGTVIGSTTTDASGNYFFDVEPGTYSIAVTAPAGFVVTGQNLGGNEATDSDIDPATGMSDTVTVAAGETNLDLDAGIYETASLGDRVWVDSNANGVQDAGEVGKAGVTVELYTCVGDMPDTLVATQVTDAGGNYNFAGLTPGEYIVKFIAADGSVLSTANVGDDAFDSDAGADGLTGCYTLSAGQTETSVDAGFYEKAEIGDRVWLDANKNGIRTRASRRLGCDRQARRCGRQRRGHGHHGCQRQLPVRRAHAGPVPGRLRPGHAAGRLCGDDQGRRGQHRHERLGCQPGRRPPTRRSSRARATCRGTWASSPRRHASVTGCGSTPTPTACRTRARPASPASPSSSRMPAAR
ncbi:MAG: carboxypeptidase regulatory-like domain-containing protein [Rhodocyclaceae bacterium]|nr:carboxypeptidase regulatory-like domain-containing protein [Rhodocyclaceae bacterium]